MIVGGNSVISFKSSGESEAVKDIYSVTIQKIIYILGANTKEIFVHLNEGANLRYFSHKKINKANKDLLLRVITYIIAQALPYVVVKDIIGISSDKSLAFSVIVAINESILTVPVSL